MEKHRVPFGFYKENEFKDESRLWHRDIKIISFEV
jgi:hypothetical protein